MTSTLKINTIEPEGATTNLAIGESGQDVILPGNDIRANVLQDAGGNAIFTSDGSGNVTSTVLGSSMVLLSTQTASDSASISFTSDIDSTYDEYIFYFTNINTASDGVQFMFQINAVGETGYNEPMTTTYMYAYNQESGTFYGLHYEQGNAQYNGTAYQYNAVQMGNEADQNANGEFHLFNPSSTIYVKNWYARFSNLTADNTARQQITAGYINVTAAIDDIQFKPGSGNFDGTIKMYGVK